MRSLLLVLALFPIDAAADCLDYQLFVKKDAVEPMACTPSHCEDITAMPAGAKPLAERSLAPVATWSDGRKACHGKTCRAVGAKLTAELVRRTKLLSAAKHHELEISFTIDHKIAVVTGPLPHPFEIWDIAKDARLSVKPSPDHPKAQIALATVVGKAVIVDWNDGLASVHDVAGQRGSTFRAGLVAALDDTRAVVIGWTGTVTTIEMATGKASRSDQVLNTRVPFETDVMRLGASDVVLLWIEDSDLKAARLFIPADAAPTVARQTVASCK